MVSDTRVKPAAHESLTERGAVTELFASGFIARCISAAVLMVAAVMKSFAFVGNWGTSTEWSRTTLVSAVVFEAMLALWLMSGWRESLLRRTGLVTFVVFTSISLYRAIVGYRTCACFGSVSVYPWFSTALDVTLLLCLLAWKPRPASATPRPDAMSTMLGAMLIMPIFGAVLLASHYFSPLLAATFLGRTVAIEPSYWIGQRFPLLPHIKIDQPINEGHWTLVFYRQDCQKCAEIVRAYHSGTVMTDATSAPSRVALIEVPPYGQAGMDSDTSSAQGALIDDTDWFIVTPTVVSLQDGFVVATRSGNDAVPGQYESGSHFPDNAIP